MKKIKNIDRQDKTEEESLIRITLYITEDLLFLKGIKSQTNERIKRLEKERNKINSYLFKKEKNKLSNGDLEKLWIIRKHLKETLQ